jgi:hypothetical protein
MLLNPVGHNTLQGSIEKEETRYRQLLLQDRQFSELKVVKSKIRRLKQVLEATGNEVKQSS